MLVIESDKHVYEMSASNAQAASCDAGATVLLKTWLVAIFVSTGGQNLCLLQSCLEFFACFLVFIFFKR
ncbi:MAG: hypothetical protein LBS35_01885 [Synergistaceae bacterium]|nr:hypothetical protein [Synergistaceae bacterium]